MYITDNCPTTRVASPGGSAAHASSSGISSVGTVSVLPPALSLSISVWALWPEKSANESPLLTEADRLCTGTVTNMGRLSTKKSYA